MPKVTKRSLNHIATNASSEHDSKGIRNKKQKELRARRKFDFGNRAAISKKESENRNIAAANTQTGSLNSFADLERALEHNKRQSVPSNARHTLRVHSNATKQLRASVEHESKRLAQVISDVDYKQHAFGVLQQHLNQILPSPQLASSADTGAANLETSQPKAKTISKLGGGKKSTAKPSLSGTSRRKQKAAAYEAFRRGKR